LFKFKYTSGAVWSISLLEVPDKQIKLKDNKHNNILHNKCNLVCWSTPIVFSLSHIYQNDVILSLYINSRNCSKLRFNVFVSILNEYVTTGAFFSVMDIPSGAHVFTPRI
jgi:hypothetical protein